MKSNSNRSMRNYAIMGAIGVGALVAILLAIGFMQAPQVDLAQDAPGTVGTGPTLGAGADNPGPGDGAGVADPNPVPIPSVAPTASIAVSPNPASPGEQITVTGSAFSANQEITVMANNMTLETDPPVVTTDAIGDFQAVASLPEDSSGELNITAADESNRAATITVDVTR